MNDSIVYVTMTEDDYLLRVIKVHPVVKDGKYSYGAVKLEVIDIKEGENGEEYELVAEVTLSVETAAFLGNILHNSALECIAEINELVSMASIVGRAFEKADENSMYR